MMQTAKEIMTTFEQLPANEQREVAALILRRTLEIETPSLSDEELILSAEDIFLELDQREAEDARS